MKFILAGLVSFVAPLASAACPDFSGGYTFTPLGDTLFQITQVKCESLEIRFVATDTAESFKLDGTLVKIPALGAEVFAKAFLKSEQIVVEYETHWKDGAVDRFTRKLELFHNSDSVELLDSFGDHREDGLFFPTKEDRYFRE